jgi:hypothetical protein
LNHIEPDSGIPLDSINLGKTLARDLSRARHPLPPAPSAKTREAFFARKPSKGGQNVPAITLSRSCYVVAEAMTSIEGFINNYLISLVPVAGVEPATY